MDFREMQYITTVADCKSVTAAAKKLYISQPSLSYIISKVEQDVGVKLFDRKNYPLTLTYAGEKYVDTARKILMLNDNLRRELVDIGLGQKGRIDFGMPTERAGYMLPRVIPKFREQFPQVEVRVRELKSDELLEALLKDEINFFILPRNAEDLPAGVKTELIYKEKLYLAAGPGMVTEEMLVRSGEHAYVDLKKLAQAPFILLKKGHSIRRRTDRILKKHKIIPDVVMEVSSCISALQLADSGLGITMVPQRAPDVLGGVENHNCYFYAPEPESWNVNLVYKEDAYLDRAERYLIDLMKQVFGGA